MRGLYVHVPFCASRCSYCGFYTLAAGDQERYLAALLAQLAREAPLLGGAAASIYLGGGTPSWLAPAALERLLGFLAPRLAPGGEFSVECNPEDVDTALLARLTAGGVTRVSLGLQSTADAELAAVGRRHDAARGLAALDALVASGLRVSVDLLLGLPLQTPASFAASLAAVLARRPEHLSLYCLELDAEASLARRFRSEPGLDPGEDFRADRYLEAHARLAEAGYAAYEVSNWCLAGGECRHNLAIWRGGEFLGLGPGAHSRLGGRRWSWLPDLAAWQAALLAGAPAPSEEDPPDAQALALERLLLGLRTREGLPLDEPLLAGHADFLVRCEAQGWARRAAGRWQLTPPGWLRLDGILAALAS
ncbi:coproporphyrinogen III oxidase family protein [bacterium]|nr:coproporphyrinogen III oxidase family protein [bacterium]